MPAIDTFFENHDEKTHPLLRSINEGMKNGVKYHLDLHVEDPVVGLGRVTVFIHVASKPEMPPTEYTWSAELNAGLIDLGIRAVDKKKESVRFAMALRDAMKEAEKRHGNGFFNSVLVDLLTDQGFKNDGQLSKMLKAAVVHPASRSASYELCRDSIAMAIRERAAALTNKLKYKQDEAKVILTQSLAKYLDDRFSITARKHMGLL